MKNRCPQAKGDHFDLLPFISILMCTLGCLLLVTMSMATLNVGPSVGEGWAVIHKTGLLPAKVPILIEWDGKTATVHRDNQRIEFRGGIGLSPILDELQIKRNTHYVLFAVRPSGFENLNNIAQQFRERGISIGYEPVAQTRRVRLISKGFGG